METLTAKLASELMTKSEELKNKSEVLGNTRAAQILKTNFSRALTYLHTYILTQ
jgi:hypothetical protein